MPLQISNRAGGTAVYYRKQLRQQFCIIYSSAVWSVLQQAGDGIPNIQNSHKSNRQGLNLSTTVSLAAKSL